MTKLPVRIPALPNPATARPMMSVMEFGATPDINDPSRNMNMANMYDHLMWNNVNTRPNTG